MPSTNLTGKTKADLVVLAELSGLMNSAAARRMTKAQLLEFLKDAEQQTNVDAQEAPSQQKTAKKAVTPKTKTTKRTTKAKTSKRTAPPQGEADLSNAEDKAAKVEAVPAETESESKELQKEEAGSVPKNTKTRTTRPRGRPAKTQSRISKAKKDLSEDKSNESETKGDTQKAETDKAAVSTKPKSSARKTVASSRTTRSRKGNVKAKTADSDDKKNNVDNELNVDDNKTDIPKEQPEKAKTNRNKETSQELVQPDADTVTSAAQNQKDEKTDVDSVSRQNQPGSEQKRNGQPDNNQRQFVQHNQNGQKNASQINKQRRPIVEQGEPVSGTLEIMSDGYGFLRKDNYLQGTKDIYVPPQYIRRFNLRTGDYITGPGKLQRENDRYQALLYVKEVNGTTPDKMIRRPQFDRLTPIYPDERYRLETARNELSTRIIDLAAPIGKGQRGMIVSPPKAGKTILLQKIANAISVNNPEVKLIVLLIDERPEEVTDMQRSIKGEVVYSTFDKTPENHVKVTELVLERAMRLVELKQDVVILLDSMTRLARAYNLTINPTGRTLSGGLDPGALYGPKRFFGAARNIENGGSLTIIATSLIETGSRMDEVIFEEFKGTGNMEVYLDRKLSEKRIFPAIDINRSGTRREELLMTEKELDAVWSIRKAFSQLDTAAVTETIINLLLKTQNNEHFISSINVSFNDKSIFDAMRGNRPAGNGQQNQNSMNNGSSR